MHHTLSDVPADAIGVLLDYLSSEAVHTLGCTDRRMRRFASEEGVWRRIARRELGVCDLGAVSCPLPAGPSPWRDYFAGTASLDTAVWEGELIVVQCDAMPAFCELHPALASHYDFSKMRVDPIPFRITTWRTPSHTACTDRPFSGRVDFFGPPQDAATARPVIESHPIVGCVTRTGVAGARDAGSPQGTRTLKFSEDRQHGTEFLGEAAGRRAAAGVHTAGCFYMTVAGCSTDYSRLKGGSAWQGTCMQHGWGDNAYPMRMRVDQISAESGVTQGEVSYPSLGCAARCAGVHSVREQESPAGRVFSPRTGALAVQSTPPPPMCAMYGPTARSPTPQATKFLFCEYEAIKKGQGVVPTYYVAVVSGDVMVGAYYDLQVLNHGTFYLVLES